MIDFYDNKIFDTNFITANEGGNFTFPYHPDISKNQNYLVSKYKTLAIYESKYNEFKANARKTNSDSGITICVGFDLKLKPLDAFNGMTNQTQANLLRTAIGKTKEHAYAWLWNHQSEFGNLSGSDSKVLMNWIYNQNYRIIKKHISNFDKLPISLRTATFDLAHNGTGSEYYTGAINHIIKQDVLGLVGHINRMNGIDRARRNRVIELIRPLISSKSEGSVVSSQDSLKKSEIIVEIGPEVTNPKKEIKCSLFFGNEFNLSEYVKGGSSNEFFRKLLTDNDKKIPQNIINIILGGIGLEDEDAVEYIKKNYNEYLLTSNQSDLVLNKLIIECRSKIKEIFNKDFTELPKEINTALVSYFLDANILSNDNFIKEISPLIPLVADGNYDELANKLELLNTKLPSRYNNRRIAEANYIRNRQSDSIDYSESSIENVDSLFTSEDYKLKSDYAITQSNYRELLKQWNNSYSDDEVHSQITKDISDSYADLLEKYQINVDNFYSEESSDYEIRLKIKKIFNDLTRSKAKTYYQIERDLEEKGTLILLSSEYQYFPYATGMFYQTKLNAVNRCKYRIKKLEKSLEEIESNLSSYGVSHDISDSELIIISTQFPVVAVALILIRSLLSDHKKYSTKLSNEKSNLINLSKELIRFTKTNNM